MKFTETYYDDAERLAHYLSARDGKMVEIINTSSAGFPLPAKSKTLPFMVNAFKVGRYEIAYLETRSYGDKDLKYRNRNLHRIMMGERIREAREACGMSLDSLELLTGIKARNLENIENGRYDASIDILGNIGDAIGCHLDFIKD
ncbi:MAG: helix-turn-helix transcriptional regulator [Prevotella sp.]|nr:helix-turn-helix transcriptional regulator [Prevotella sp.]